MTGNVEYRDIRLILAVAEECSFSRAAEKCFLTQPAISKIVKRAEELLGAQLFDRSAVPLKLTPEGEIFCSYFRRIESVYDAVRSYSESLQRRRSMALTVGAPSFFCTYVLPPLLAEFRADHPGSSIRTIETNDDDLRRLISTGVVDLGISVEDFTPLQCTAVPLMEEHILLGVPKFFPVNRGLETCVLTRDDIISGRFLSKEVPAVQMDRFRNENFLMLKQQNDLYRRGMQICRDAGFTPTVTMELDQLLSAYYLADSGAGITFLRAGIPCYVRSSGNLNFYKINHPDTCRTLYVYSRLDNSDPLYSDFLSYMKGSLIPG